MHASSHFSKRSVHLYMYFDLAQSLFFVNTQLLCIVCVCVWTTVKNPFSWIERCRSKKYYFNQNNDDHHEVMQATYFCRRHRALKSLHEFISKIFLASCFPIQNKKCNNNFSLLNTLEMVEKWRFFIAFSCIFVFSSHSWFPLKLNWIEGCQLPTKQSTFNSSGSNIDYN